jgi:hypothetical protein
VVEEEGGGRGEPLESRYRGTEGGRGGRLCGSDRRTGCCPVGTVPARGKGGKGAKAGAGAACCSLTAL